MPDEKKEKDSRHPEINFLPPLKMFLAFFDKESRQKRRKKSAAQEDPDEKNVEKLIEKLTESEEDQESKGNS